MIIAETERLRICQTTEKDIEALAIVLASPVIMKYSTVGVHSKEQIVEYVKACQKSYTENGYGPWVVYGKENNEFLGVCGINLHLIDNEETLHVNYRFAESQHGKGYATEATLAVLDFCKNKLQLDKLAALIERDNTASSKVAERVGFRFKKTSSLKGIDVDFYEIAL